MLNRHNLIDHLSPSDGKDLACNYLNNVLINKQKHFTRSQADKIKNSFMVWSDQYTRQTKIIATFIPPPLNLNNVTTLPVVWTADNFWSTQRKVETSDVREKSLLQENLATIAAAAFPAPRLAEFTPYFDDLKHLSTIEQLAKGYAYREPKTGENIKIYAPETGHLADYQVEVIPLADKINAFGLLPLDPLASPILLFRGTATYPAGSASGATIVTDFDPRGIGIGTYLSGKQRIRSWMEKAAPEEENKIIVTGHSLGSAYATYAAIDNPHKVKIVYGFGSTKVSFLYKQRWEKVKDSLTILNFKVPGDKLATFGDIRVATKVFETTTAAELPSVETVGEDKAATTVLVRWLNNLRPASAAHRLTCFDKELTLREAKFEEEPGCLKLAMRITLFIPLYLTLFCFLKLYQFPSNLRRV